MATWTQTGTQRGVAGRQSGHSGLTVGGGSGKGTFRETYCLLFVVVVVKSWKFGYILCRNN